MTQRAPAAFAARFSAHLDRAVGPAFAGTLAFSATLMFAVQPMFAKMATPLLGGSPGVWNTALVFFQAVLLLGYLYAHALSRHLGARSQMAVHAVVLVLGVFALPLGVSELVGAPPEGAPTFWLLALFAVSLGAPFFAISATAPLLQAWYARTNRADAQDPYHLYAASNIGSLGALIAYPLILEPTLSLAAQSAVWSTGYVLLAASVLACGYLAVNNAGQWPRLTHAAAQAPKKDADAVRAEWRQRLVWMVYAFVPSSLLLGVTTHITTDVASAPFLWVVPLALFLLTYVIAFARKPFITEDLALRLQGIAAAAAILVLTRPGFAWSVELILHLAAFFLTALVCHFELVKRRPEAARLTEFYLFMSLGGVLGGAFNALIAPMIFSSVVEYPMMLLIALLLRPTNDQLSKPVKIMVGAAFAALGFLIALRFFGVEVDGRVAWLFLGAGALAAAPVRRSRYAFAALSCAVLIAGAMTAPLAGAIHTARGFFGVHRVVERDGYRLLAHGTTVHGIQSLDPAREATPMSYYGPLTPIGQSLRLLSGAGRTARVGAVGLGAGSIACYANPGERWSFYEIDPLVRDIAQNPRFFGFLTNCGDPQVVIGDARLTLANEPAASFNLLVLDAFTSDVVPTHLLTREAFELYFERLSEGGVIIAHISNRLMDLEGPLADIIADLGYESRVQIFVPPFGTPRQENEASHVMVIARNDADLALFDETGRWRAPEAANGRLWTDDYVNIPGAILARLLNEPDLTPSAP